MSRQKITLKRGEELLINGYVIRAVGDVNKPEQLQVYRPNMLHIIEANHNPLEAVYAGIRDTVVCDSTLTIGTAKGLLEAPHADETAVATVKKWLREHSKYFTSNENIMAKVEEALKA
jgi:hypothetical protein